MKKLLVIAIAAFAFTACNNTAKEGEGSNADSAKTGAEATPAAPAETPAPETPAVDPNAPATTPAPTEGAAPTTEAPAADKH